MGSSMIPEKSSTGALSLGGFTFLAPPKLKIEEKKEKETVVEKKTDSPFATFTFSTPTTTGSPMLKDLLKPASAKSILKETQFKTPETHKQVMFSSTGSDFGTLAKLSLNSTSNNSTPVKPFQGSGSLIFSGTPTGSFQGASPSSPNVEDDFVPNNEFKPVIPLPELVDVKSGEENEDVLFEERAKLLRFCKDTKEWKERGIGKIKILKDQTTGVIRLLMRRDQVLKVCCNHRLTKDIELKPFPSSDKAATWAVKDYSEEVGKDEVFTIRFKTSEQVQAFKAAFVKAQESLGAEDCSNISNVTSKFKASDKPKLTDLFKPPAGSWNCEVCYIRNAADQLLCPACGTSKPGVTPQEPPTFTFGIPPTGAPIKFENKLQAKSTPGSWECGSCYIRNDADVTICLACDSPKPGSSAEKPEQTFTFGVSQSAFNTGSSNKENKSFFGGQKCDSTTESGTKYIFGTQTLDTKKEEQKSTTSGFSFGTSAGPQDSISSGFTFGTQKAGESTNSSGFTFGTPTNQSTGKFKRFLSK
jgi:E3 SUMO-protein ligase RanBP2